MNHILINATHKEEIRVAIVKNHKLTNLDIETSLNRKTKGNIYKGKISRVEQSLEAAANDQLFELNDSETRANFVNIVEPFLTDIQAQRGIEDFRVICDETNNTPDIVDNNEFRADIFIQPARSINFVTLTFVATRGGISFSEVTGT